MACGCYVSGYMGCYCGGKSADVNYEGQECVVFCGHVIQSKISPHCEAIIVKVCYPGGEVLRWFITQPAN